MIYLDYAATSFLKPPSVYRAVQQAMLHASSPGRGVHRTALAAADLVYECREAAAALFHVSDPSRVVFTLNATHALNIAIHTLVRPGSRVLISGYEHNAVRRPLIAAGAELRVFGRRLFDPEAALGEFRALLSDADAVVCTHVSNVFGYILPIEEIAALCRAHRVPLIVDASQSAGVLELDLQKLGADFIAMPGHKALFGPQGTGLLLCGGNADPLLYGGTGTDSASPAMPGELPERLEAGTLNVPGIAGLCAGIRYVLDRTSARIRRQESELLEMLTGRLRRISGLRLYTAPELKQAGILSFSSGQADSESLCAALAEREICVRGGLHCAPLAHESAGTRSTGTVRISLSPFVTEEQIMQTASAIGSLF